MTSHGDCLLRCSHRLLSTKNKVHNLSNGRGGLYIRQQKDARIVILLSGSSSNIGSTAAKGARGLFICLEGIDIIFICMLVDTSKIYSAMRKSRTDRAGLS